MNTVTSLSAATLVSFALLLTPSAAPAKETASVTSQSGRPALLDRLRLALGGDSAGLRSERRPSSIRMPFFDFRKGS